MSARLNMNERRNISWKGRTFNQVVAGLKKNTNTFSTSSTQGFFLAPPIKHYRREIANTNASCKTRANVDGDAFFQPGGTINNTASSVPPSYVSEFNLTVSDTERPTNNCDTTACSKSADAKRRVRSSGNIKRKFSASNDTYYTSTNEYLISRNRTVKQNEVFSVRYGDPTYKPGEPNSIPNIYTPNGINHCAKVSIKGFSSSPLFQYQWLDATINNFTIADGNYDIGELNSLFQTTLMNRGQYYNDITTSSKVFLYNFAYDTLTDKAQIQCFATDTTIHPDIRYARPLGVSWVKPSGTIVPVIRILNNIFQTILGISAGNYPLADISGNTVGQRDQTQPATRLSGYPGIIYNIYTPGLSPTVIAAYVTSVPDYANGNQGNQFKTGTANPAIGTPYVPLYYKPSNSKFASQGSVDSSARLTRLKYDTVTNSANTFLSAYGKQTANSLAYGVPSPGYTIKDKVGYPAAKTPTVSRGIVTACESGKLRGG
jgi:hypothetical protein